MKTMILSDHTGYMANENQREFQQEWEAYVAAKAEQDQRIQHLKQCLAKCWKARKLGATIGCIFSLIGAITVQRPSKPLMRMPTQRERVWQSGHEGERWIAFQLAQCFGDEWTLICGYRSFAGEVDQILVGPNGVCALEIKNLNGTVYIDGDQWRRDKYDRYGNLVESGLRIEDRRGRSCNIMAWPSGPRES